MAAYANPHNNNGPFLGSTTTTSGNNTNNSMMMDNTNSNGPRAKCDQVIFEAMAKASEIIVNGRTRPTIGGGGGGGYGGGGAFGGGTAATASSRFNLMVPELQHVRQILQRWRRALHVPLRLDLYYHNPETNQNELVERWCLEYYNNNSTTTTTSTGHTSSSSCDVVFQERECRSNDPIVQLRHVCKKIVIWLRNLYCSSRLLPAQALQHPSCGAMGLPPLQFSIYTCTQQDQELLLQQGFQCQAQPSTVLTPYGELKWTCHHAPKAVVERYLPPSHPLKAPLWKQTPEGGASRPLLRNTTAPMAIPRAGSTSSGMDQLVQAQQQLQQQPLHPQAITTAHPQPMVPQSAPAGGNYFNNMNHNNNNTMNTAGIFQQNNTNNPQAMQQFQQHQQQHQQPHHHHLYPNNTYHAPRHFIHRSNSQEETSPKGQPPHHGHHPFVQRRNTSLGIPENVIHKVQQQQDQPLDSNSHHAQTAGNPPLPSQEQPERIMSGLSLALMTDNSNNNNNGNNNAATEDPNSEDAQVEKRRAALHHAPPQFNNTPQQPQQQQAPPQQQQQAQQQSQTEYGYAYNNHISWNQIRPSTTVPIPSAADNTNYDTAVSRGRLLSNSPGRLLSTSPAGPSRFGSSPSPLVGTPPSGAFLRTGAGTTPVNTASLLPPRNLTAAPPFPTRPMGFATTTTEGPTAGMMQQPVETRQPTTPSTQQQQSQTQQQQQPLTSLDLLHSSPFQQQASISGSMLSMFRPPTSLMMNTMQSSSMAAIMTGSETVMASTMGGTASVLDNNNDDDEIDMPFAVEDLGTLATSTGATPIMANTTTTAMPTPDAFYESLGASSAAVASFAQKCAPAQQHRLKLFDHAAAVDNNNDTLTTSAADAAVLDLTSQLAEFKTFGASLTMPLPSTRAGVNNSGSDDSASLTASQQPIPLRTN